MSLFDKIFKKKNHDIEEEIKKANEIIEKYGEYNVLTGSVEGAKKYNEWVEAHPDSESVLPDLPHTFNIKGKYNYAKYSKAEELFKAGKAVEARNEILELIEDEPDEIGYFVFVTLADIEKEIQGYQGVIDTYDLGIHYYTKSKGEYAEKWVEYCRDSKKQAEIELEEIKRLKEEYHFSLDDPEILRAVKRLDNIKAGELRYKSKNQNSFNMVYNSVLDMVNEYENGGNSPLNGTTVKGAKTWLKEFSEISKE